MRTFKKIIIAVAVFALSICVFPAQKAFAIDYTDESIIFDVEYTGHLNSTGDKDKYLLCIPSTGILTISGYYYQQSSWGDEFILIDIYDIQGEKIVSDLHIKGDYNGYKYVNDEKKIVLSTGQYLVFIKAEVRDEDYAYTFSYSFDSSTNAKISSPKKGALKVTAPKGTNIDGFEVRYRISGEKTWTTEIVETKKNLNKTFKGLKAGKKYEVQTRKYVSDEYGYTYYSSWTTKQNVTIKK